MMKRRELITFLGGAAAAWPLAAHTQPAGRMHRIGILETVSTALNAANYNALLQGLRELGYEERQNLVIEYRSADGRTERFPELATDLLRLKVDVIVTRGTPAALAAKHATGTIPVVMAAIGEPLSVVASLAHPGGNVTGLSAVVRDLYAKRVELLKEMVPTVIETTAFMNMSNPASRPEWKEIETAARSLSLRSRLFDLRTVDDIEHAFYVASRESGAVLIIGLDTLTQQHRKVIAQLAAKHRLPAIYASREFVDAGGLIFYGVSYPDLYHRAATYIDKIFKGRKPENLPIEQPTKFEMVINLKTAKALGITIPPMLLARADEVIE